MLRSLLAHVVVLGCLVACAQGADFLVQSTVHVGEEKHESTTIFGAGRMYDLLANGGEVTVFDAPNSRFVVLDPQRKVKTEITTAQIDGFCQRIRSETLNTNDLLSQFLVAPSFEEAFNEGAGELTLTSAWLVYRVKGSAQKDAATAQQYAHFVQWQTKLNTLLHPGNLPPFTRLALNAALEKRSWIPTEVEATRQDPKSSRRPVTLRSEHRVQSLLLASDAARVDEVDRFLATFAPLSLLEYQRRELSSATNPTTAK